MSASAHLVFTQTPQLGPLVSHCHRNGLTAFLGDESTSFVSRQRMGDLSLHVTRWICQQIASVSACILWLSVAHIGDLGHVLSKMKYVQTHTHTYLCNLVLKVVSYGTRYGVWSAHSEGCSPPRRVCGVDRVRLELSLLPVPNSGCPFPRFANSFTIHFFAFRRARRCCCCCCPPSRPPRVRDKALSPGAGPARRSSVWGGDLPGRPLGGLRPARPWTGGAQWAVPINPSLRGDRGPR